MMQTIQKKVQSARAEPNGLQGQPVEKLGELLLYRPRMTDGAAGQHRVVASDSGVVAVRYGGRDYLASRNMAESFMRRAREIMAGNGAELVPLLHHGGIDLLLVTGSTNVDVLGGAL